MSRRRRKQNTSGRKVFVKKGERSSSKSSSYPVGTR